MTTETVAIGVRVNEREMQVINEQIEAHAYNSVSDFLRSAVREKIARCEAVKNAPGAIVANPSPEEI